MTSQFADQSKGKGAPVPPGPTDEELLNAADDSDMDRFQGERSYADGTVINEGCWEAWDHQLLAFARAVLARWGSLAPQPVPVSERLPGPEDCDEEGQCWLFRMGSDGVGDWLQRVPFLSPASFRFLRVTHWLPAHALPTPGDNQQ